MAQRKHALIVLLLLLTICGEQQAATTAQPDTLTLAAAPAPAATVQPAKLRAHSMEHAAAVAPTATPTPLATATAAPTASPRAGLAATAVASGRFYGVLFGDNRYLQPEWDAGIRVREVELSWRRYEPQDDAWDAAFVDEKRWEFKQARDAGFLLVLDLGLHYPPDWARNILPWKDQYGNTFTGHANAVWSPEVRAEMDEYIRRAMIDFGKDWLGIRVGSGGWIETMYPPTPQGYKYSYWAFDSEAMKTNPVPHWRPGQPSPNGEARRFYVWYLHNLMDTMNWQHQVLRRFGFRGKILQLFAGIGVRPKGYEDLIADNLIPKPTRIGVDAAERGVVIDRLIDSIQDKSNVVIVSTSLGDGFATAPWLNEASADPMKWSSAHWVAHNANRHGLPKWGENTGNNDYQNMQIVFKQLDDFGYSGLFWAWSKQLHDGVHASIDDYARLIAQ